ncbi:FAD-binding oxidoreductase [Actinomyces sp. B33]|uniref:FAD-binding and (Fe-S)-binding domain-containing protein n=1 Tax=Actinomyces sp. B33 TaxID=2942131 RepID=UPI0023415751|nr:FAD-binding and (Fe-S)-binding domain-containing protein [Actinomyces sp. B33]MDC4233504.1 FAD-binding oxidoreductase [Actinomyces sp. B33]
MSASGVPRPLGSARSSTPRDPSPVNGTTTLQAGAPANPAGDPRAAAALADLERAVTGEVDWSTGTRARYSTDAGLYRIPPLAVVFPSSVEDVLAALDVARSHRIPITSRGGGTSCSGNAVGPGIVLDFSRHLTRVVSIDPQARTAVVEPGCIEADLQEAARPFGLRFGPDPSSQNRATIAGMVGNNACGPHATAWGRTCDNVVALDCVDGTGRRFTARTSHAPDLPEVPGLAALVDEHLAPIRTELGSFGRQVSGYSLEHLAPERRRNLAAMLTGSEGTLVTLLSVTVRLVPIPRAPVLVALGYPDMIAAADDVPAILAHEPLAVEGMDRRLVDVVRRHNGPGAVPDLPEGEGWLLCEVGGDDEADSLARARAMAASASTRSVAVYPPGEDAARLWRIRADGAGLGGRTPVDGATGSGNEQAWPGFEDAAVPPESLGAYLRDFTALMDEFGIDGLLYGHFGDGCVHVRLDFPLDSDEGVARTRRFLERAAEVCASHGGSVSGEHGDGRARTELLRYMYSPDVLDLFARVKGLFDPENLLNPGVLAAPMGEAEARERRARRSGRGGDAAPSGRGRPAAPIEAGAGPDVQDPQPGVDLVDHFLRRPAARSLPADGGFSFREDHGDLATAVHRCTGVGKCRAQAPGTFMCPSWRASADEKDVTRGRARILQEAANGALVAAIDSPEVLEALDLCLACKACSSDCPAGVDMAKYRSEVYFRRYRGRLRPLSHYALGWLPRLTRLTARIPGAAALGNAVLGVGAVRRAVFWAIGLDARRSMPPLQAGTFSAWAAARGYSRVLAADAGPEGDRLGGGAVGPAGGDGWGRVGRSDDGAPGPRRPGAAASPEARRCASPADGRGRRYVVVWADSFSQTLDDSGARALTRLLEDNGFAVVVAPDVCCGLTWITTGQLAGAKRRLGRLLDALAPFAANGIPIVGVEPSCTAVLRDDLLDLLPDDPRSSLVSRATHTLAELLEAVPADERRLPDLTGVEVVAQPHCHHYSVMGWDADERLLRSLGAQVTRLSGCCGLAGNFGMERGHYEMSVAVAEQSLLPALRDRPGAVYLADGFSCRTQAAQLAGRDGVHLAALLARRARPGPGGAA